MGTGDLGALERRQINAISLENAPKVNLDVITINELFSRRRNFLR